ncbi:hypothetical protein [Anaerotignum propionicum]|nr:hypothetical protein [Anaerotignum propionicum]
MSSKLSRAIPNSQESLTIAKLTSVIMTAQNYAVRFQRGQNCVG